MLTYTDSIDLAWRIAAGEAHWLKHKFIEKEHILIALCKIHKLNQGDIMALLGHRVSADAIKKELLPVLSTLETFHIRPKHVRRRVRGYLGKGDYEREKGEVVHRSEDCKRNFYKAEETARAKGDVFVYPVHLIKALLCKPGEYIDRALRDLGTSPGKVLEILNNVVYKEQKQEEAQVRQEEKPDLRQSSTPFFNHFCSDLTAQAGQGALKPLVGRKDELLQVVRTLLLRDKNNPVLVGDAGVGKTAIVEGLANRIASGSIHSELRKKRIMALNIASLVSGTKYRGEFEERILGLINEANTHPEVILFIDEIHTLVGAGGAEGALDASNIMKPTLARGEISVIGATTLADYDRHIAKDNALERRFQPILVKEPDSDATLKILQGLKESYERDHGVCILPDALCALVDLSIRHLPYRRLPDKAVELMDKACVRVKVPNLSFREEISIGDGEGVDRNMTGSGSQSFIINAETVAEVVSQETGIPVGTIREDERDRLLRLDEILRARVIGQDDAVEKITQFVKLSRSSLKDYRRPSGVFLFLGPTGVGKTELSKALAEALFGSEDEMLRFDMSEYMEKHDVAKLIGAPPGYLGCEAGGQLTNMLRRKPYLVVLFDEIEKAHTGVFDIFLQLFDEGRITDGKGRTVNARNALLIMTSNIGTRLFHRDAIGFIDPNSENGMDVKKKIETELKKTFRPEFLNRLDDVIIFRALGKESITEIAARLIDSLKSKLNEKRIYLDVTDRAVRLVAQKGYVPAYGARELERVIKHLIEIPINERMLREELVPGRKAVVDTAGEDIVFLNDYGTE